jgi:hypothetical protein
MQALRMKQREAVPFQAGELIRCNQVGVAWARKLEA